MNERPFHYGLWRVAAEAHGKRHGRSRLAPSYTESDSDEHAETTYYGGMIGDKIEGCVYREDGTRALYSRTTTGKIPTGFEVVEAALRGHEVKTRRAKKATPRQNNVADAQTPTAQLQLQSIRKNFG